MNNLDRFLGHQADLQVQAPEPVSAEDAAAIASYDHLVASTSSSKIENAAVEAFDKLTPAQLDLIFERFIVASESPAPTKEHALHSDPADEGDHSKPHRSAFAAFLKGAIASANWGMWAYAGAPWDEFGEWSW